MAFAEESTPKTNQQKLEEAFELMRSRNWLTEQMVEAMQHHCNCTREEALAKLIRTTDPATLEASLV